MHGRDSISGRFAPGRFALLSIAQACICGLAGGALACGWRWRSSAFAQASHAKRRAAAVEQVLIARKRPDRKEFPVAMVAQIKHTRKTRRREALFIP